MFVFLASNKFLLVQKQIMLKVGAVLARLCVLAHLGWISPLRNFYKNIMCSYEKWFSLP